VKREWTVLAWIGWFGCVEFSEVDICSGMIGFHDLKEGMLQFDKADRCKVSGRREDVGCKMRDLQCA
jgi:hypothetical protein